MDNTQEKKQPSLHIYTRIQGHRQAKIGARIGVAFEHKDGQGLNIILDAQPIPLDGRIELVGFPPKSN
ncbi:MAG: hypothetical protein AAF597_16495 [Bacteroidota bacterium]